MRNISPLSSHDRYEWLSAYIDDELVPHDRQIVEEWLATDPQCKADYDRLMRMRKAFQLLRSEELTQLAQIPQHTHRCTVAAVMPVSRPRPLGLQNWGMASFSLGTAGLLLAWSVGLRLWSEPIGSSIPLTGVATVPSPFPLRTDTASRINSSLDSANSSADVMNPGSDHQTVSQTVLVSTESNHQPITSLNVALDQPILAVPVDQKLAPEDASP